MSVVLSSAKQVLLEHFECCKRVYNKHEGCSIEVVLETVIRKKCLKILYAHIMVQNDVSNDSQGDVRERTVRYAMRIEKHPVILPKGFRKYPKSNQGITSHFTPCYPHTPSVSNLLHYDTNIWKISIV